MGPTLGWIRKWGNWVKDYEEYLDFYDWWVPLVKQVWMYEKFYLCYCCGAEIPINCMGCLECG